VSTNVEHPNFVNPPKAKLKQKGGTDSF